MADIIDLKSYRNSKKTVINTHSMKYRLRALAEGQIRTFNCDNCGEEFEVYYDEFPDKCPGCKAVFDWEGSKVDE